MKIIRNILIVNAFIMLTALLMILNSIVFLEHPNSIADFGFRMASVSMTVATPFFFIWLFKGAI